MSTTCLGQEGAAVVFVGGLPAGASLFREVQQRLLPQKTIALEVVEAAFSPSGDPVANLRDALLSMEPRLVVAHGVAVPLVLNAVEGTSIPVFISNGPLRRMDWIFSSLAALPTRVLSHVLLRPLVFNQWLASSLGMRRAVVNPYVMDDTVVETLTRPVVGDSAGRQAAASWIKLLPSLLPSPVSDRVWAIWGDADRLYPVDEAMAVLGVDRVVGIPGGRWFHPEERPWALADACSELMDRLDL